MTRHDVAALLPLQPTAFHILIALAAGERHGYAIIGEIAERTGGTVTLTAGTLYRNLERMVEDDLIAEVARRPPMALDDPRRRYYRITALGTSVIRAELRRLNELVRLGKAVGLVPAKAER